MNQRPRRIAFLAREEAHGGGAQSSDRTLMSTIVSKLRERGAEVSELDPQRLRDAELPDIDILLSMARSIENLSRLASHNAKLRIINDPQSTLRTLRDRMYTLLPDAGVRMPATRLVDLRDLSDTMPFPYWLKRKSYHHILPGDVVKVSNKQELAAAREHFLMQEHPQVFQQEHVEGNCAKLYAVYSRRDERLRFFASREQLDEAQSQALQALLTRIVKHIPLEVFGVDVILGGKEALVVDVNAFPSFRQCLQDGSDAIVDMIWHADFA